MSNHITSLLMSALHEVEILMFAAYANAEPIKEDSSLTQAGLLDGGEIVRDCIAHGEAGLAFEHLLYMVTEPPLLVSSRCLAEISAAGTKLGFSPKSWSDVRTYI
jgi:hypothetical protein